jgi:5'-3' exonuclease
MAARKTALIDGDLFVFESATRGEQKFDWDGDGETVTHADLETAKHNLRARIDTCVKVTEATRVILAFGDPSRRYFRHKLLPSYKQHRTGSVPPMLLRDLRVAAMGMYETKWFKGLEADDVLGLLMTDKKLLRGDRVCVTRDKDLQQVPGEHLNHGDIEAGTFVIEEDVGAEWHMTQTLIGDTCDNYKGCPGVGPVRAKRVLDEAYELWSTQDGDDPLLWYQWDAVCKVFKEHGLKKSDALRQARVARILQAGEYDVVTKKVTLWQPPAVR